MGIELNVSDKSAIVFLQVTLCTWNKLLGLSGILCKE